MNNPILDELHAIRRQMLADAGGTLAGLVAKIQADQAKSDRVIIENVGNHPMQPRGEVGRFDVVNQPSPPADR